MSWLHPLAPPTDLLPQVCVFYEKQHMQEAVLRKANMELGSRQEEIRFLKMEV